MPEKLNMKNKMFRKLVMVNSNGQNFSRFSSKMSNDVAFGPNLQFLIRSESVASRT